MNSRKIRPPDHPAEGPTNNAENNTIIPIVRNLRSFSFIMIHSSIQFDLGCLTYPKIRPVLTQAHDAYYSGQQKVNRCPLLNLLRASNQLLAKYFHVESNIPNPVFRASPSLCIDSNYFSTTIQQWTTRITSIYCC